MEKSALPAITLTKRRGIRPASDTSGDKIATALTGLAMKYSYYLHFTSSMWVEQETQGS